MFDLSTAKFVVWGYRPPEVYHTHSHIHEGFYRALKYMGKQVLWLDELSDISEIDFSNTCFITNHDCADPNGYFPCSKPKKCLMPIRDDCFYFVHGMSDDAAAKERLSKVKNVLTWNVYHDFSRTHWWGGAGHLPESEHRSTSVEIDEDFILYPNEKHFDMRWATDLTPDEIEKNKPTEVFRRNSKQIYWVGTVWRVNEKELADFRRACSENEIEFIHAGAGQHGILSIEENIKLVQQSYMAPAISGTHHLTEGYAPCRIFKNISYGQFGITNSKRVNDIFNGRLIYNPDAHELFYDARERLSSICVEELHSLMDYVAQKHTYIHRLENMFKLAALL